MASEAQEHRFGGVEGKREPAATIKMLSRSFIDHIGDGDRKLDLQEDDLVGQPFRAAAPASVPPVAAFWTTKTIVRPFLDQ